MTWLRLGSRARNRLLLAIDPGRHFLFGFALPGDRWCVVKPACSPPLFSERYGHAWPRVVWPVRVTISKRPDPAPPERNGARGQAGAP